MSKAGKPWVIFGCSSEDRASHQLWQEKAVWVPLFEHGCISFCSRGFLQEWDTLCVFASPRAGTAALTSRQPRAGSSCSPCSALLQQKFLLTDTDPVSLLELLIPLQRRTAAHVSNARSGSIHHDSVHSVLVNLLHFECSGLGIVPVGCALWGHGGRHWRERDNPSLCCPPNPHLFTPCLPGSSSYSLEPQTLTASSVPQSLEQKGAWREGFENWGWRISLVYSESHPVCLRNTLQEGL